MEQSCESACVSLHVSGYTSWRNTLKGSWFIQSLCKVFEEADAKENDILTMLTKVNRIVAIDFKSHKKKHDYKEMPSIVSTLTRKLYLINSNS